MQELEPCSRMGMVACGAKLGSGSDPGSPVPPALWYEHLEAAHHPPTTTKQKNPEHEETKRVRRQSVTDC